MKKVIIFVVLAVLVGLGVYAYINYGKSGIVQEIVNSVTPANKDIKQFLPQGRDLSYPLKIPSGFRIGVYSDLGNGKPRVLALDPLGVLVASVTNEGKVVAMVDKNKDGEGDSNVNILTNLDKPHGIFFSGGYLYVGETSKVTRYIYDSKTMKASSPQKLFDLPGGGRHFTRTLKVYDNKLYTSVGSSCDVCVEKDMERASILVSDIDGKNLKEYARGLRNTVFFTFDSSGRMWGNDMGRDFLGDSLPPDELNIIESADYGWPYCYGSQVRDSKFESGTQESYCTNTKIPAYEYHAHVAPLGITFIDSALFNPDDQGSILAAFHGSWNSTTPVGYKIVKLRVSGGKVIGMDDFISGFIQGSTVLGRPVDLLFDKQGYLYITDDKSGLVYVVSRN